VGIGTGPLAGGFTLQQWGLRAAPLAGVGIAAVALALMIGSNLRLRQHQH
jgi:predicted MFS family arabinose efflux permease